MDSQNVSARLGTIRFVLAATICLMVAGCDDAPSQPTNSQLFELAPAPPPKNHQPSSSASSPTQRDSDQNSTHAPETRSAQTAKAAAQPDPTDQRAAGSSASKKQPDASAPPQPIPATPEQLAKWHVPEFEALQLLACVDDFDDSFALCLDITPDGQTFVVGGERLTVWTMNDGARQSNFLESSLTTKAALPILCAAFSPDGKFLAAGDGDGTLRVWQVMDQREVLSQKAHDGRLSLLAWSPDSQQIATTSYNGQVVVWSADGRRIATLAVDTNEIGAMVYIGEQTLAAATHSAVSLWDTDTGRHQTNVATRRYGGEALAFHPNAMILAYGDDEPIVHVWDVKSSSSRVVLQRHSGPARLADFSPDGSLLATFADDSVIRIWDVASGQTVQAIDAGGARTTGIHWLPEGNVLATLSQNGRLRFWGRPGTVGIPAFAGPIESPSVLEESVVQPDQPATAPQLRATLDLRSFPRLPGATPEWDGPDSVRYATSATREEALTFYHHFFAQSGWQLVQEEPEQRYVTWQKNGHRAAIDLTDGDKTDVSLHYWGNVDTRTLPRSNDGQPLSGWFFSTTYRTNANVVDLEVSLLRAFHQAGWTPYTRLNASTSEEADVRHLEFVQNGMGASLYIGRPANNPAEFFVQCSAHPMRQTIPIPRDSGWIELDDATGGVQLVARTSMSLEQAVAFYDNEMTRFGWVARPSNRHIEEDRAWLPYILGQQDVVVGLAVRPNGTYILTGERPEQTSWQLAEPEQTDPERLNSGIEAADFPLPKEAGTVTYDRDRGQLEVPVQLSMSEAVKVFTQQMEERGWKFNNSGFVSDEYSLRGFAKGDYEITLRFRREADKPLQVSADGDGILWTKPVSSDRQVVSYATWLRRNQYAAGLDRLDEYQAEMRELQSASSASPAESNGTTN